MDYSESLQLAKEIDKEYHEIDRKIRRYLELKAALARRGIPRNKEANKIMNNLLVPALVMSAMIDLAIRPIDFPVKGMSMAEGAEKLLPAMEPSLTSYERRLMIINILKEWPEFARDHHKELEEGRF